MPGPKGVGFVVPEIGEQSETAVKRHPKALKMIAEWVATAGFDAAIWTALATNFTEKTKKHFSVKAAIRYLKKTPQRCARHRPDVRPECASGNPNAASRGYKSALGSTMNVDDLESFIDESIRVAKGHDYYRSP